MKREQVAPGVVRIALLPLDVLNVYLLDDVLVDSGSRAAAPRLLSALSDRAVRAHAITHAHFDHAGSSHAVCAAMRIPMWCGRGDRKAVESADQSLLFADPKSMVARLARRLGGPAQQVERTLGEGDRIGSFEVLETPGHTPGHLAFWREVDRVLVLGDVLFHRSPLSLRPGLHEPFLVATADPAANRRSARRLAELSPAIVCFGHGAPLRDPGRLREFVARLPE